MQSALRLYSSAANPLRRILSLTSRTPLRPLKLTRQGTLGRHRCFCSDTYHPDRAASDQFPISQRQGENVSQAIDSSDTIYALSTPPGRAAVAVIRISGSACLQIYRGLCPGRPLPRPRTATVRKLTEPGSPSTKRGVLEPQALVLYFPGPKTVTGEDVLELHTHGGPAIVKAVLKAIPLCTAAASSHHQGHDIRYAEPGEFTKRAFYNNRLDLTQVEGLSDALAADTEQQRRLAVQGTGSSLATRYNDWRHSLLRARAELEALIDFSEDQDFDESAGQLLSSVSGQVLALQNEISLHVENASKGELLRNGISIALLGAPNSGKSSLLNTIVGREAAIVNSEEGTTRDIVDISVDIGGWLCHLGDMAGLRTGTTSQTSCLPRNVVGSVEREGMRRAKARAMTSDVVIVMLSVEVSATHVSPLLVGEELGNAVQACHLAERPIIVVVNKIDHLQTEFTPQARSQLSDYVKELFPFVSKEHIFPISCLKASEDLAINRDPGKIQEFLRGLQNFFADITSVSSAAQDATSKIYWEESLSVSHRQSEHLRQCLYHSIHFLSYINSNCQSSEPGSSMIDIDLAAAAEHLRFAGDCLAKITGKGAAGEVEEVLGVVFEK